MTKLYSIRFALLASASLLLTGVAHAQSKPLPHYSPSTPTMVQAAPGFPMILAEQIARDVTEDYDPRTGETSLVAAPFDPFEQDSSLAASVNLRTANQPVAIDGTKLYEDGAILEMKLYYNSPSDDPYEGRGYSDAAFLNGDFAPVITRDNRILECSTRVENVVYEHHAYYNAPRVGIYRPYRHYTGHYGFADRGFGVNLNFGSHGFFDRSFSSGRRSFSSGSISNRGLRTRTTRQSDRAVRRFTRDHDRDDRAEERRERRSERDENRDNVTRGNSNRRNAGEGRVDSRRESVRRALRGQSSSRRSENRLVPNRTQSTGSALTNTDRATIKTSDGKQAPRRERTRAQTPTEKQSQPKVQSRSTGSATSRPATKATTKPATKSVTSKPSKSKSSKSNSKSEKRTTQSRAKTKQSSSKRSTTTRRTQTRSTPRRMKDTSSNTRRHLDFFPRDGYGARDVVTSRTVDCAREETLRVFLPAERLDAARFDGLTLIVLDQEGYETPVFIPPNYIEGFRLAATGQIRPQGIRPHATNGTLTHVPQGQVERQIESASCPIGTILQPDGTCLLNTAIGDAGYP